MLYFTQSIEKLVTVFTCVCLFYTCVLILLKEKIFFENNFYFKPHTVIQCIKQKVLHYEIIAQFCTYTFFIIAFSGAYSGLIGYKLNLLYCHQNSICNSF